MISVKSLIHERFILERVEHVITADMESMARPRESLAACDERS